MSGLVLVVDDDPQILRIMSKLFRADGWDVATADSVAAALFLLTTRPRYLVVDLELPDGDGETVVRSALAAELPPRVVVCSGVANCDRLQAVSRMGPRAVLSKPVDFADVLSALAR
jgi:CheY-like chemotaxis protein